MLANNHEVKESRILTVNDDEIYDGKINVIRRYKTTKFVGFEFQIEGTILVDENNEIETDYFRYERHVNGEQHIVVAERYPEDEGYFVYDDASYFFDLDKVEEECHRQYSKGIVEEETAKFLEFLLSEGEESSW